MSTSYDVINPANEQIVKNVAHLDLAQTDAVIAKAQTAFESWKHVAPGERARLLRAFSQIVTEHREELAQLEITNSGHTRGNALWEADNVANTLMYYSAAPERLFGKQIPVAGGIDITFKEPLGVVGIIVPWNFPMPIAGWGFAPALAAGNTVVLKPAEYTPLTAIRLGELALLAGIPEGVLNILPGKGSVVGNRFVTHPLVRKVGFTGSTQVGKQIMAGCADQVKRVTLELGGKSANIIFADADIEKAAASAPGAVFDNAGQDCCARSRILVQKSAFDSFMEHFEVAVKKFRVEDPNLATADMGPLISKKQFDVVESYLDEKIAFQGSAPSGPGFWMPPTVLLPKNAQAKSWREEIFGPVVSVLTFEDEAQGIAMANDSEYGLSASVFTRDIARGLKVARQIKSGICHINGPTVHDEAQMPFGGVKSSGYGRFGGKAGIDAFTELRWITIETQPGHYPI